MPCSPRLIVQKNHTGNLARLIVWCKGAFSFNAWYYFKHDIWDFSKHQVFFSIDCIITTHMASICEKKYMQYTQLKVKQLKENNFMGFCKLKRNISSKGI